MRVGYVPYSRDLSAPGDRRRFVFYAQKRGIEFEIADPAKTYDVVVVTPRTDLARWREHGAGRSKLVFDIVDSYLALPRADPKALLRGPAKFVAGESRSPFFSWRRAVERILERADAATCATPEQAAAIRPFCPNVHAILDAHSEISSVVKDDYASSSPFKLVWEGLGENAHWFSEIRRPLAAVARERPLELHLVTAPEFRQISQRFWRRDTRRVVSRLVDNVRLHPWSRELLPRVATACDLAVIPLPLDRPFERGKPESKLISFWRMGLPVLASATPAYARVMTSAGQDLLCAGAEDWVAALERMIDDGEARERAGRGGRAYAEREYSDERLLAAWDRVFASL
jgi:glycosyltransferase involved in cell wall biosynthesis